MKEKKHAIWGETQLYLPLSTDISQSAWGSTGTYYTPAIVEALQYISDGIYNNIWSV